LRIGEALHSDRDPVDESGMPRLVLIALASFWLTGCFVLEELRKGDELIEQHSSNWRKRKEAEASAQAETAQAKASKSGPILNWTEKKDQLAEWWREVAEEEPIEPDPDDHIIRCDVRGQIRFTRKSQCETRGGRIIGVYSKANQGT
jgi:hypothetical protein